MRRCMHAGHSGPGTSGMKKVARSKGARVAASLDTGTVLQDLLQTVAPATPDSASGSSGSSSGSAAAAKSTLQYLQAATRWHVSSLRRRTLAPGDDNATVAQPAAAHGC